MLLLRESLPCDSSHFADLPVGAFVVRRLAFLLGPVFRAEDDKRVGRTRDALAILVNVGGSTSGSGHRGGSIYALK